MNKFVALALILWALWATGCDKNRSTLSPDDPGAYVTAPIEEDYSDITDPEVRWKAYHLNDYVIRQQLECFCINRGPFRLFVVDNQIRKVVDIPADTLLSEERIQMSGFLTIDSLFALARELSADTVAFLEIQYDERFGYPKVIRVDKDVRIIDEEFAYLTSELVKIVEEKP